MPINIFAHRIRSFTSPPSFDSDYKNRVAQVFNALLWVSFFADLIALTAFSIFKTSSSEDFIWTATNLFFIFMSLFLLKSRRLWASVTMICAGVWVTSTCFMALDSGFHGMPAMGQFFIIFLVSFVIRGVSGIHLTLFSIFINTLILWGQTENLLSNVNISTLSESNWFTQSIFILMAGVVGAIANRRLETAITEAQKNAQRFQTIFEQTDESIIITSPDFIIQDLNPQACLLLQEPLQNLVNNSLLDHIPSAFRPDLQDIIEDVFTKKEIKDVEFETQSKDESPQFLQLSVKLISLERDKPDHIMVILRDITIQKSSQKQVQKIAFQDHLTRLENRFSFNYKINSAIAKLKRDGGKLALIFIDIDGFKRANDRHGHLVGDKLLHEFAYRLRKATREDDFLARIGGDEFVLILENLNSKKDLENTLERISLAVNAPYTFKDITIHITASIGTSTYPEDGTDADTLLKRADEDMFKSKPQSRGRLL